MCNINRLRRSRIQGTPYQGIMELDDRLSSRIEIRERRERISQFSNPIHTYPSFKPSENLTSFPNWPVGHNSTDSNDIDNFYVATDKLANFPDKPIGRNLPDSNHTDPFFVAPDNLTRLTDIPVVQNLSDVFDETIADEFSYGWLNGASSQNHYDYNYDSFNLHDDYFYASFTVNTVCVHLLIVGNSLLYVYN